MTIRVAHEDSTYVSFYDLQPTPSGSFCDLCGQPIEENVALKIVSPGGSLQNTLEEISHLVHLTEVDATILNVRDVVR